MIRCLMLAGLLLSGQAVAFADDGRQAEIDRLVRQLDAPQLIRREAAEAELLGRGLAVLDLLPPEAEDLPAEVRQRLDRIRRKLQEAAANAVAAASRITIDSDAAPLSEILAAFEKQSGNAIVDCRRQFGQSAGDPKLSVRFDKTPFWPALDQLLDQAGLALYPYAKQQAIGVVAAPGDKKTARLGQVGYSGPFRFEPVSVIARRDLREADGRSLVLTIEVAWEPRLQVIGLLQRMADVRAVDDSGEPLPAADPQAQPELPISGRTPAVKLDLPLRPPSREAKQIASLNGKLTATIPGKIETFRFRNLSEAKNLEQRIARVAVTLEQVQKAAAGDRAPSRRWEVRMKVRFDNAGDALASHRQWIFNNEAYLEGPDGKQIAYEGLETTAQGKNELGVAYLFSTNRPLAELTFVYKTPGTIVTRSFEYELKDILLP